MTKSPPETKPIHPRSRWLTGLLGLAAIIAGQARLASDIVSLAPPSKPGIWLNEELHLAIPSIDNVLAGLPLLLVGGFLLALALRGLRLLPLESPFRVSEPPKLRVLKRTWYLALVGLGSFAFVLLRLKAPAYQWYQVPLWFISLGAFAFLAFQLDLSAKVDLSPQLTRSDLLWMIGLCLAGVLIGTFRLEGFPEQLIGDEGNFWNIARDIARGTLHPSLFGMGVYTFPVFSSMFQAWFLRVFGINLWGWRLSSVLTGLLTLPPLYLLVREAFNRVIAIVASLILLTSPYFLAFSRLGYNNIQALFVTTLAFYWLYAGLKRKSSLYYYLAGCTAGFGFYVYFSARLIIVALLLMLAMVWLVRRLSFREAFQATCLVSFSTLLVAVPHIIYGAYHDPQAISFKTFESVFFNTFNGLQFYSPDELFAVTPPFVVNGNELFYHPVIYLELIARGLIRTLLAFQKPWLISEHFIAAPLTGTIGVVFYLVGITLVAWRFKRPRNLMLLLWFLFNVLGLSTLNTVPPRHTHMVAVIPALAIFTALGIHAILAGVVSLHERLAKKENLILLLLVLLVGAGGLWDYFIAMPREYRPHPDQVILWAALNADDEALVTIYTDPDEKDLYPRMLHEYRESLDVRSFSFEAVKNGAVSFPASAPTIVFYAPDLADSVEGLLKHAWGTAFISRSFYSSNGTRILAAGMNVPFVFEADKSIGTVLADTFGHPPLLVLILVLALLFLATATYKRLWSIRLPAPLKRFTAWLFAPCAAEPLEEQEPALPQSENVAVTVEDIDEAEPPDWATAFADASESGSQSHLELKPVKSSEGLDIYLHLRIPRWRWPFRSEVSAASAGRPIELPELRIPNKTLLIASVFVAITAQVFLAFQWKWAGWIAYLLAGVGLMTWAHRNPKWRNVFHQQLQITPKMETILSLGAFALMAFLRFFDLGYRVYGLEADETKWTVQSWYSVILGLKIGEFHSMHYEPLPVDFWIRSFFLRTFGLNFLSARIESAVTSLVSLAFLYLIIRLITRSPATALLGSLLYGMSFISLNASHQALHNTPVEPWIMGSIFFFVWGLQGRAKWKFQAAGLFMSLGMLTYETFYSTVLVIFVYALGTAVYELARKRETARNWLLNIALLVWPVILVYMGYTQDYLDMRKSYIFGWLWHYSENGLGTEGTLHFILQNIGNLFTTLFSQIVFRDSLLNWPGPLLTPLLLPFVVIGFFYNIWNIKKSPFAFLPVWFFLQVIPGPLITGSVWPRVLFTAVGPLVIWGALGLWVSFTAIRAWSDQFHLRFARPLFGILVLAILVNNYFVFSSELVDPVDRQERRELADLTSASALESDLMIFPYIAYTEEAAEVENHVILFSVAGALNLGPEAEAHYRRVEYKDLMTTIWQYRDTQTIDVIITRPMPGADDARAGFIRTFTRCYPLAVKSLTGKFFDVYSLSAEALRSPVCYSPPAPTPVRPAGETSLPADTALSLIWNDHGVSASGYSIEIERRLQDVYWLEAEEYFHGPGWGTSADFVKGFKGKGFLLDDWGAGKALYQFPVAEAGRYRAWVRYYKRVVNDQRNYLNIQGQSLEFAETGSPLNEWAWKDLGVFDLPAGETTIGLSRLYGHDDQYSVFVDTVVLTPDTRFNPGTDSEWETVMTSNEVRSQDESFAIADGLPPGDYRWKVRIFDGDLIIDALGERGIESVFTEFRLEP